MQENFNNPSLRFLIGDVRDKDRLRRAMNGVDYVIHAAALKQVPACEYNPIEAIKTNIDGTINVIEAAIDCGVDSVLGISSDKAVYPINLYGATKLAMEKLFMQANGYGNTRFSIVRPANFWGSRGSVIPLWESQSEITITDKEMTRYWIKLDKIAKFVIYCLRRMEGQEIFIPKMEQMTLGELAEKVKPDAKQKIVGIRAGEKMHELLMTDEEKKECREYDDFYIIKSKLFGGDIAGQLNDNS